MQREGAHLGAAFFREAQAGDVAGLMRLYRQLHPDDPDLNDGVVDAVVSQILNSPGLRLFVLEQQDVIVATTYLNVIPNLTRLASPYAVIENVVVDESLRRTGLGRQIMAATLD